MLEWSAAPLLTVSLASKRFSPLKQWLMKQKVFNCVISWEPVEIIIICSTTQSTQPSSLAVIVSVVQNVTSKSVDLSPVCLFFSFHLEVFRLWEKTTPPVQQQPTPNLKVLLRQLPRTHVHTQLQITEVIVVACFPLTANIVECYWVFFSLSSVCFWFQLVVIVHFKGLAVVSLLLYLYDTNIFPTPATPITPPNSPFLFNPLFLYSPLYSCTRN